jgi:DNA-binding transcriptional LysR family regulator
MELRQLRYFVAVAECGSFVAASQRLFIAQPALSVQIRALEEHVGQALFMRHRRGISLTEVGGRFLADTRATLSQLEAAVNRAKQQDGEHHLVRFGLVPSATQTVMPPLARSLRASHPTLRIETREMSTSAQLDGLKDGTLDFCLGRPAKGDKSVKICYTGEDPYCLALPADHPLSWQQNIQLADVAQDDFVSFGRERGINYFDRTIAMCVEAGFSPQIRHESNTFSSALGMVAAGLGVSIVPASCALLVQPDVVLRRLPLSKQKSLLALMTGTLKTHPAEDEVVRLASAQIKHTLAAGIRGIR